jgi:hypothetical protein
MNKDDIARMLDLAGQKPLKEEVEETEEILIRNIK